MTLYIKFENGQPVEYPMSEQELKDAYPNIDIDNLPIDIHRVGMPSLDKITLSLYIRIQDGKPVDHPILENNFIDAYPNIDTNNLPPEFMRFERVSAPSLGLYEKNQSVSYEIVDGICKDVWKCEVMSNEEKAEVDALVAAGLSPIYSMRPSKPSTEN